MPCNKEALLKRLKKLSLNIQVREVHHFPYSIPGGLQEYFVKFCRLLTYVPMLFIVYQDDRLRTPLLKLKLAVCSVMPEQIAKYNMDCMAKVAAK